MTALLYLFVFLVGFIVVGVSTLAVVMGWGFPRKDSDIHALFRLIFAVMAGLGMGFVGGFAATITLGIKRGEPGQGIAVAVGIVLLLFLISLVRATVARWHARQPEQVAQREAEAEWAQEKSRENTFLTDYSPFLRAVASSDLRTITASLNVGFPYILPAPGTTPKFDREWTESVIKSDFIRSGRTIYRLSALEMAAWYGHTEIVALLLERQSGTWAERIRLRQQALGYARKYNRVETIELLEVALRDESNAA